MLFHLCGLDTRFRPRLRRHNNEKERQQVIPGWKGEYGRKGNHDALPAHREIFFPKPHYVALLSFNLTNSDQSELHADSCLCGLCTSLFRPSPFSESTEDDSIKLSLGHCPR